MNWIGLRDRAGEWGPMAFCALLSLGAFYLLILYAPSLSKVILLGVMLICPAIYFIAWLLGGKSRGGGRVMPASSEENAVLGPVIWSHQAPLTPASGGAYCGKHRIERRGHHLLAGRSLAR